MAIRGPRARGRVAVWWVKRWSIQTPGHEIGRHELPGSVGVTNGRSGEAGVGNEGRSAPRRRDLRALVGDTRASRHRHCPPRFRMQDSGGPGLHGPGGGSVQPLVNSTVVDVGIWRRGRPRSHVSRETQRTGARRAGSFVSKPGGPSTSDRRSMGRARLRNDAAPS